MSENHLQLASEHIEGQHIEADMHQPAMQEAVGDDLPRHKAGAVGLLQLTPQSGKTVSKDVEKTLVWELAKWRNEFASSKGLTPPIPENSISKPPSAELRPDQTDQDSLPEYELLDGLLDNYVEKRLGREQIIGLGFEAAVVDRIIGLVDKAEWKRRQGAIGPKITGMAFGRDRRLPITNRSN